MFALSGGGIEQQHEHPNQGVGMRNSTYDTAHPNTVWIEVYCAEQPSKPCGGFHGLVFNPKYRGLVTVAHVDRYCRGATHFVAHFQDGSAMNVPVQGLIYPPQFSLESLTVHELEHRTADLVNHPEIARQQTMRRDQQLDIGILELPVSPEVYGVRDLGVAKFASTALSTEQPSANAYLASDGRMWSATKAGIACLRGIHYNTYHSTFVATDFVEQLLNELERGDLAASPTAARFGAEDAGAPLYFRPELRAFSPGWADSGYTVYGLHSIHFSIPLKHIDLLLKYYDREQLVAFATGKPSTYDYPTISKEETKNLLTTVRWYIHMWHLARPYLDAAFDAHDLLLRHPDYIGGARMLNEHLEVYRFVRLDRQVDVEHLYYGSDLKMPLVDWLDKTLKGLG